MMNCVKKFDSIQRNLKISRNLLTQCLRQMESNGLVRKVVPKGFKRAVYKPTQKRFDLINTLLALRKWSEKWVPDPNEPRINVTSPKTGESLKRAEIPVKQFEKSACKTLHISYSKNLNFIMNLKFRKIGNHLKLAKTLLRSNITTFVNDLDKLTAKKLIKMGGK